MTRTSGPPGWLGDCPEGWDYTRLKRVTQRFESGGTPDTGNPEYWTDGDDGIAWVAIGDMTRSSKIKQTNRRITEAGRQAARLQVLPVGTLLYSMYASLGKVAELGTPATTNQAILGIEPNSAITVQRFLFWWLAYLERHVDKLSSDNTQQNLSAQKVREIPLFLPPFHEQRAIASFLDCETEKIDILIAKKRRLLDLLDEKRTALITRTVTKGLDYEVPFKESGVEWLGEIPEHWRTTPIKRVARLATGHTPSRDDPDYWTGCTIPWITLSDVGRLRRDSVEYLSDTREKISPLGLRNSAAELLPEGTVVLSRTASVGFSTIMGRPMATSQDFANWVCGDLILPEFLLFVFRGMKDEFRRIMLGSTHQTIYMPAIRALTTPLPPISEQEQIVAHIRESISGMDRMRDALTRSISLLQEYRSALISAAVTGKIDVRDKVPA